VNISHLISGYRCRAMFVPAGAGSLVMSPPGAIVPVPSGLPTQTLDGG